MSEDTELQRLKRERLAKMQKMISAKQERLQASENSMDARKVLEKVFVGRAWEVYGAARQQYPRISERIFDELAQLVQSGQLRGKISGEQLYGLLREIGLDVRLDTKIQVLEHGELKSISDKFRGD
jgi:DNA-binding TFAR19-related protein (PDSD5 family)